MQEALSCDLVPNAIVLRLFITKHRHLNRQDLIKSERLDLVSAVGWFPKQVDRRLKNSRQRSFRKFKMGAPPPQR